MIVWGWIAVYLVAAFMVPDRSICRGLFTRYFLGWVIFQPRGFWVRASPMLKALWRYIAWWGMLEIFWHTVIPMRYEEKLAIFYGTYTLIMLDDYLFGDDDRRKRFREWCGNKIKWQMELPPAPVPDEVV